MYITDYYGINSSDEEQVIKQLTAILGVEFEPHESSFWGDYYLAELPEQGKCKLIKNFYEGDNDWHYPDYKDYTWILEVDEPNNKNFVFASLLNEKKINISLLYRSEIEPLKSLRRYSFENGKFKLIEEAKFNFTWKQS